MWWLLFYVWQSNWSCSSASLKSHTNSRQYNWLVRPKGQLTYYFAALANTKNYQSCPLEVPYRSSVGHCASKLPAWSLLYTSAVLSSCIITVLAWGHISLCTGQVSHLSIQLCHLNSPHSKDQRAGRKSIYTLSNPGRQQWRMIHSCLQSKNTIEELNSIYQCTEKREKPEPPSEIDCCWEINEWCWSIRTADPLSDIFHTKPDLIYWMNSIDPAGLSSNLKALNESHRAPLASCPVKFRKLASLATSHPNQPKAQRGSEAEALWHIASGISQGSKFCPPVTLIIGDTIIGKGEKCAVTQCCLGDLQYISCNRLAPS